MSSNSTLPLIRELSDTRKVITACWLANGYIAIGGVGFLELRSRELGLVSSRQVSTCFCVRKYAEKNLAILMTSETSAQLELWLYEQTLVPKECILRLPNDGDLTHFSWIQTHLVTLDHKHKHLNIHKNLNLVNCINLQRRDIVSPWGCLITSDQQHVCISDCQVSGSVRKYKMLGDSNPEWVSEGLAHPTAICEGTSGDLYVGSDGRGHIYHLDCQGGMYCACSCK